MKFLTTRRHSPHYKWWVLSCTSLGMLLATVNSGTLIIALPDLERSLHTTLLQLVWVILVYMIVSTVLVLTAGRLSDLFGRKTAYVLGFLVFAGASLGAGFAGSGTELILWRILQGIGGAFLFANAAALVTDAFPRRELGLAMGTNTMVAAVGLVIGPVLGGGLAAAGVLLPIFVLIEHRSQAPMLDLGLFRDRLFSAASGAAFLNGLSRFALMFLFVFYFQGPQGQSPIMAGLELAPMAIGMLVASPLAGMYADKRGSRTLAALGMVVSGAGLAGMTMLQAHTSYVLSALWLLLVGVGSGMFNSPNTAAMMGAVPVHRRGVAAGARVMLQNTGAVISIAFVMAVITSAVPSDVLFKIFSGIASGLSNAQLDPFISNMHLALWTLAAISVVGAFVSMLRPAHVRM